MIEEVRCDCCGKGRRVSGWYDMMKGKGMYRKLSGALFVCGLFEQTVQLVEEYMYVLYV